jgi:hypothetical protein
MIQGNGLNTVFNMSKCMDHRLSTVLKTSLGKTERQKKMVYVFYDRVPKIYDLLDAVKALVAYASRSGLNGQLEHTLKPFADTRWTGLHQSLQSLLIEFDNVAKLLIDKNKSNLLNGIDKMLLSELVGLLGHFSDMIKKLESQKTPTLHLVCNEYYMLSEKHLVAIDRDSEDIKEMKKILLEVLENKWEMTDNHYMAAWLDPRQKNNLKLFGVDDAGVLKIQNNVIKLATMNFGAEHEVKDQDLEPKKRKVMDIFESGRSKCETFEEKMSNEIQSYMFFTLSSDSTEQFELLSFWKNNQFNYPLLAKVARTVLAIPASSSKPETDFSAAGFIKQPRRSNLAPENLDDMLTAKSNLDLIEE